MFQFKMCLSALVFKLVDTEGVYFSGLQKKKTKNWPTLFEHIELVLHLIEKGRQNHH